MSEESTETSGVQRLIDRLHQEGVQKGQSEAELVLSEARSEARKIVDQARREADEMVREARVEADRTVRSGEEAVHLAGRDAILRLSEELRADFVRKLKKLIGHSFSDTEFLRQLIVEIARRALPEQTTDRLNIEVLREYAATPSDADAPSPLDEAELERFFLDFGGEALREGLTFSVDEGEAAGIRVRLVDDDIEIDLTSDTISRLLLELLSPRFRSIFQ